MAPRPKKRRRRRCRFCRELFTADPRLKERQYACSAPRCQRQRKAASQQRWLARNPDYFKGRYHATKDWLKAHPGYLKGYRRRHPKKRQRDNEARKERRREAKKRRADIQVAISLQEPVLKVLAPTLAAPARADIQDAFLPQVTLVALFSAAYLARVRADIQGQIAPPLAPRYPPRHEPDQEAPPTAGASP